MQRVAGCGGIVLCGGRSTRMGRDKATLPFGPELLLARVTRILAEVVDPIVVVAAAGQQLPELSAGILVARDARAVRGPLEGLLAGLEVIASRAESALVTGCDVPLLVPGFVRRLAEHLGDCDIVAARVDGRAHPLPALYRTSIRPEVARLLQADQLRLGQLLEQSRTRILSATDLHDVDPELRSLSNLNHPDDYARALAAAGF